MQAGFRGTEDAEPHVLCLVQCSLLGENDMPDAFKV